MKPERYFHTGCEFRATDKDGKKTIEGYAAVFDSPADLGYYIEYVRKEAFNKTIQESDIRCLKNHDANFIIGRNKAGTLKLSVDQKGLYFAADVPDTQYAKDLVESITRGDISQCSFGFRKIKDNWFTEDAKLADGSTMKRDARELLEVQLFDVSPVTYPAYEATQVMARDIFSAAGLNYDSLGLVLFRMENGLKVTAEQKQQIKEAITILTRYAVQEPPSGHSSPEAPVDSITLFRARLDLAEREL